MDTISFVEAFNQACRAQRARRRKEALIRFSEGFLKGFIIGGGIVMFVLQFPVYF